MFGYIYKTTNLITGKIYIGQKKRKFNSNYFGSGIAIQLSIKKYGIKNFKVELIQYCKTFNSLNEKEIYWIAYYNSTNNRIGYNRHMGGQEMNNTTLLKSTKKRISKKVIEWLKHNNHPMKNKHHSKKSKLLIGKANKNHKSWNKGNKSGKEIKCIDNNCNNTFYQHRSGKRKYCSTKCVAKNANKNRKGIKYKIAA